MKQKTGFTIVELVVVIVIIAILASITLFSYVNIARDTRDTERRTNAETIALALGSWARDTSKTPIQTNTGLNGAGEGWLRATETGYSNNIEALLISGDYLKKPLTAPGASSTNNGFAFFACNRTNASETRYGVFTRLENPTAKDTADRTEWSASCNAQPLNAPYSANYVRIFQFRQ